MHAYAGRRGCEIRVCRTHVRQHLGEDSLARLYMAHLGKKLLAESPNRERCATAWAIATDPATLSERRENGQSRDIFIFCVKRNHLFTDRRSGQGGPRGASRYARRGLLKFSVTGGVDIIHYLVRNGGM